MQRDLLAAGGFEMRLINYALTLVLCLSLAILPALGTEGFPKTIVDSANRTLIIDEPVERIVPMVAWSYEPLYILGAHEKIIGAEKGSKDQYSYLTGMADKPVIGTYKELDYEKVIELKPDLVIVQPKFITEVDQKLSPLGINVVCLPFNQLDMFDKELKTLAEMLGPEEEARAEEFIAWKQGSLDALQSKVEGRDAKVKVYGEWSDTPWYTGSKLSGMDEVITMAGGFNIAGPLNSEGNLSMRYPTVDAEWVLKENPEVIIFPAFDYFTGYLQTDSSNSTKYIEEAKIRSGLNGTDAAENDRLYVIDAYLIEAARGFIGAQYLAKWLYPELFEDLNPEEIHQEYFESWLGVPYKGIWAYPLAE